MSFTIRSRNIPLLESDSHRVRAENWYLPQLDGLRVIAFLLVFSVHAGGLKSEANDLPISHFWVSAYTILRNFGWSGVDLFFVLSSFLITALLLREERLIGAFSVKKFYLRRILRIWPLYFLVLIIGYVLAPYLQLPNWPSENVPLAYYLSGIIGGVTFTMNLLIAYLGIRPAGTVLQLWSISMEEQFYLFWPQLLRMFKSAKSRTVLLLVLMISTIGYRSAILHSNPSDYCSYYMNTFARLDALILGAALAMLLHYVPNFIIWGRRFGALIFCAALCILGWCSTVHPSIYTDHFRYSFTLSDAGWTLFLLSSLCFAPLQRVLSYPKLTAIGQLTFGTYMFHGMVLRTICDYFLIPNGVSLESNERVVACYALGLPITLGCASLSWNCYEKKFLRLKKRFTIVESGAAEQEPVTSCSESDKLG